MNGHTPAFPISEEHDRGISQADTGYGGAGLTKREYFAAIAMQGYLSDPEWRSDMTGEMTAKAACHMADYLLAELDKGKSP